MAMSRGGLREHAGGWGLTPEGATAARPASRTPARMASELAGPRPHCRLSTRGPIRDGAPTGLKKSVAQRPRGGALLQPAKRSHPVHQRIVPTCWACTGRTASARQQSQSRAPSLGRRSLLTAVPSREGRDSHDCLDNGAPIGRPQSQRHGALGAREAL